MRDPALHTNATDFLPEDHPLAYVSVYCIDCTQMVHCGSNECMTTWVETGVGNLCLACYSTRHDRAMNAADDAFLDDQGLPCAP